MPRAVRADGPARAGNDPGMRRTFRLCGLLATGIAAPAWAALPEGPPPTLATAWTLTPWTLAPLLLLVVLYAVGCARCWPRRGVARADIAAAAAFACGVLTLVLALVWPLDAFAAYALSAHVAQHMTLLALVPPLLLAGRSGAVMAAAVTVGSGAHRRLPRWLDEAVTALAPATVAHVGTMLAWHLPAATSAALASEAVHRAMNASVLLAGLWFWSAVWRRLRARDGGAVGGLVALVTAMMMMGFLGALLTFAPRLLYPAYSDRALLIGVDPARDQQLAGLLMWVPSGVPYLAVGLVLAVALMRRLEPDPADHPRG